MGIRNVAKKGKNPQYALYKNNKMVKYLGGNFDDWLTDAKISSLYKTEPTIARALDDIRKKESLNPVFPKTKYSVVLSDPPWRYDFDVASRATEKHYPTLTLLELKRYQDTNGVRVTSIFAKDCILFLWATSPKLDEAMHLIPSWGFKYKTHMVWAKDKIGLGWYCRNKHELLLIAERGSMPLPDAPNRPPSVIEAPRTTHSHKPDRFYQIIEQAYPEREYLEMFGIKNERPHWHIWGNRQYA